MITKLLLVGLLTANILIGYLMKRRMDRVREVLRTERSTSKQLRAELRRRT